MDQTVIFPRYDSYKDSGFDWIGDIPSVWELKRLAAVFEERKEKVSDKNFPPLSVTKNGVVPQLDSAAKSDDGENRKGVRQGDFVINSRSDRKGIAKQDGSVSLISIVLRPKGITLRFCEHLLKSNGFIEEFYRNGHGIVADLWTTRYWDMRSIYIPIPDIQTQERIGNFLDQKAAEIDEAIAKKQRLIELLKEQKAILINQAVTKGLNPDVPMRDSGVAWIGEVPAHWGIKRVKNVSNFITSGPRGWADYYSDTGAVFLQSGNLTNSVSIDLNSANRVTPPRGAEGCRTRLRKQDVLVCITGANTGRIALAKIGTEEVYINQHLCLIRPINDVYSRFLAYCLYSNVGKVCFFLRQYGLKEGLGLEDIKNATVLVPPIDEQKIISTWVESLFMISDHAVLSILGHIEAMNVYKTTLISEAVTGKIKI
jgi:type I restriction enzyme, S subunit